jgi:hypothetical protein
MPREATVKITLFIRFTSVFASILDLNLKK